MLKIIKTEDCPFRNSNDNGQTCNLTDRGLKCERYWEAYPEHCPLLDEEVTIKRQKFTENVK